MSRKFGGSRTTTDFLAAIERITKGCWPILPEICGADVSLERHCFTPTARSAATGPDARELRKDLHVWEGEPQYQPILYRGA
jgi:hypothetical protein